MGRRSKYDKEFKLNALRLYEESGMKIREFEKEMGIGSGCISHWKRELKESEHQVFPGKGNARDKEISELKKEIERLRQERDILKRPWAYSQNPQRQVFIHNEI
jgi:transposase